jgi:hypothetical protein
MLVHRNKPTVHRIQSNAAMPSPLSIGMAQIHSAWTEIVKKLAFDPIQSIGSKANAPFARNAGFASTKRHFKQSVTSTSLSLAPS